MQRNEIQGERLTVYCRESDRCGPRPLHEWLIARALEAGIARGGVVKAYAGFGRRRQVLTQKLLTVGGDLSVRIELIDTPGNIDAFLIAHADVLAGYTFVRENIRYHPAPGDAD